MQVIPLQAIPNQRFNIVLNDQNCTLHLYQRRDYMFLDLSVDNVVIRQGMICLVNINLLFLSTHPQGVRPRDTPF